ncbi:MAG: hypothetical protein HOQ32_13810 [Lysobacter sp.]|nr:hypothetical protein [Lysobacter sp.]
MKRWLWAAALASLGGGYWLVTGKTRDNTTSSLAADTSHRQSPTTEGEPIGSPSAASPAAKQRRADAISPEALMAQFPCAQLAACESQPTGASNAAEAQWLMRRGYPTAQQRSILERADPNQLMRLYRTGDRAAGSMAGSKLLASGRVAEGLSVLSDVAMRGSPYAYYALGDFYAGASASRDPIEAAAYYRLAYLEGDWKSPVSIHTKLPALDPMQQMMADKRAINLLQNMRASRRKLGIQSDTAIRPLDDSDPSN